MIIEEIENGEARVEWLGQRNNYISFKINRIINEQRLKKIEMLRERKQYIRKKIEELDL